MLIACQSCYRQYDVGDLAPGARIRCACGTANVVPRTRARRVEVAHCANCGGVRDGEGPCPYCAARPAGAEKGLGEPCPECFARLPKGARFCHGCGIEIAPAAVVRAVSRTSCPRCAGRLVLAEGRGDPFHQCSACGGLWLSRRAFQRFVDRAAGRAVRAEEQRSTARSVAARPTRRRSRKTPARKRRRPIACPTCALPMLPVVYARYSGIEVDACQRHGWWFDDDELERLGKFVAAGGLEAAERRQRAARRVQRSIRSWREKVRQERRQSLAVALATVVMGLRSR